MHPLRQPRTLCVPSLGSTLPWKLTGAEDSGALQIRMIIIWFMHHVCYVLWYLAPEVRSSCRNIITQITGEIFTLAILMMQRIVMIARMLIMPRMMMIPMQKLLMLASPYDCLAGSHSLLS